MVNYTAGYICFINIPDGSSLLHISHENINYDVVNNLTAKDFLLNKIEYNHGSAAMRYILGCTLEKHFGVELKAQKHVREGKLLPKYFNWPMPPKSIQCAMRKTDVIPLPILPLNKVSIAETINILYWLTERLGLKNVVEDEVIPIKRDILIVRNITCAIY